jgi:hypothetical protein
LFSNRLTLTLYLTSLTYPSAAYYMTVNSDPINHDKADSGLNTTPSPLLPEQLLTRLSAKKTSASKTCPFSDFLLKAVCCCDYLPVEKSTVQNLIKAHAKKPAYYVIIFAAVLPVVTLWKE